MGPTTLRTAVSPKWSIFVVAWTLLGVANIGEHLPSTSFGKGERQTAIGFSIPHRPLGACPAARSMRTSRAPIPRMARNRSSGSFVFRELHGDEEQHRATHQPPGHRWRGRRRSVYPRRPGAPFWQVSRVRVRRVPGGSSSSCRPPLHLSPPSRRGAGRRGPRGRRRGRGRTLWRRPGGSSSARRRGSRGRRRGWW
jgi:hypothetical protein